jgi:hypothetical protein
MKHTTSRPKLTALELREIGLRRDPTDIIKLLWEIKRLRHSTPRPPIPSYVHVGGRGQYLGAERAQARAGG